jgi:hypothetical protein
MGSVSWWVLLVVAAIGAIATVSGVLITQRRSDARDDMAWTRERERERERWKQEDAARTFDLRREAYVEYYAAMSSVVDQLRARMANEPFPIEPGQIGRAMEEAFTKVSIYGSKAVYECAKQAYWECIAGMAEPKLTLEHLEEMHEQRNGLLNSIRRDLSIPRGQFWAMESVVGHRLDDSVVPPKENDARTGWSS